MSEGQMRVSGTRSEAPALGGALALTRNFSLWERMSEGQVRVSGTRSEAPALGGALALTRPSGTLSQRERGGSTIFS
jgi:hypothetical protein